MKNADEEISAIAGKPEGISAKFLSMAWHIKNEEAVKVLEQTTQLKKQGAANSLSRRHTTNDRM